MKALKRLLLMLAVLVAISGAQLRAEQIESITVLDLRQTLWRFRLVRGTTEYLTAPNSVERVIYRPKNPDIFRRKIALEPQDYTVEQAKEYLLPEQTPPDWMNPEFDDGQWLRCAGPVGFQDEGGKLILARASFAVKEPAGCKGLKVSAIYRGGIVLYLNGVEILRRDMLPGSTGLDALGVPYPESAHLRPDGRVLTAAEAAKRNDWDRTVKDFEIPTDRLRKGVNVLAVSIHRAPLDKVCLLRANGEGRSIALGAGGPVGWPTVALTELKLTAPAGVALVPNVGAAKLEGFRLWNHNAGQNIYVDDPGDALTPLKPVAMAAPRNGRATGVVVAGAPRPIQNISVNLSDLKGPRTIPARCVRILFALPDGRPRSSREDEGGAATFDTLADTPPAAVPVHAVTGLAIQPL